MASKAIAECGCDYCRIEREKITKAKDDLRIDLTLRGPVFSDGNGRENAFKMPAIGDSRYLAILDELAKLHVKKAADYGRDTDPLANVRASEELGVPAWKGAFLRAIEKVHRIKSYCINGRLENEGVEDSFKDLAAYALIALVLFREMQEANHGGTDAKATGYPGDI